MSISNINIEKIIAHEVIRASELNTKTPIYNNSLINLNESGKELVIDRIIDIISPGSHCIDLVAGNLNQGGPFNIITNMLDYDIPVFIRASQGLAKSLSQSQTAGSIKAGSAIFIKGNAYDNGIHSRFIAIIKADSDKGLSREIDNNQITLKYVNDILLGDSSRLIKIALFIENNPPNQPINLGQIRNTDDFTIKVYDHLMQNSTAGNASQYFYSTFLKCKIAENAARKTMEFYEITREFINNMDIEQDQKVEYYYDLISYLRSNDSSIIEPATFARGFLPDVQQDNFLEQCERSGLTGSISKDTRLIKGKLGRQSLKFTSKVTIIAPPEVFNSAVQVTGPAGEDGWTTIKIKGEIEPIK